MRCNLHTHIFNQAYTESKPCRN